MTHRNKEGQPARNSYDDVRIDRWLWAARFFRTRQLAAEAIKSGKVEVNGARAKPARNVSTGDTIRLRKEKFVYEIIVKVLTTRRQSAQLAIGMYEETDASIADREKLEAQTRLHSQQVRFDQRKPDRRRRQLSRLIKRSGD